MLHICLAVKRLFGWRTGPHLCMDSFEVPLCLPLLCPFLCLFFLFTLLPSPSLIPLLFFCDRLSLCISGWPQPHNLLASAFGVQSASMHPTLGCFVSLVYKLRNLAFPVVSIIWFTKALWFNRKRNVACLLFREVCPWQRSWRGVFGPRCQPLFHRRKWGGRFLWRSHGEGPLKSSVLNTGEWWVCGLLEGLNSLLAQANSMPLHRQTLTLLLLH